MRLPKELLTGMEVLDQNDDVTTLVLTCRVCGTSHFIYAPTHNLLAWLTKKQVLSVALPNLTQSERELLLSRTCGPCYDEVFDLEQ